AEFVHGKPKEIWRIIRSKRLVVGALEGDNWCARNHVLKKCNDFWARWTKVARYVKRGRSYPDRSFAEFLQTLPLDEETKNSATEYVQGFNAARADLISLQHLSLAQEVSDNISGNTPYRILSGYDSVVHALSRFSSGAVDIRLNTVVDEIQWRPGR